ncbi:MAG TPA: transglycosylase SLT domain-containing protein [Terriglobales bacterium]|nr:transglycosylase SLT domain-containing protein [Terriglobales bacterium]
MLARTVIFVLLLGVYGTFGCARVAVSPQPEASWTEQSGPHLPDAGLTAEPSPSLQAWNGPQEIREEELPIPDRRPVSAAKTKPAQTLPKPKIRTKAAPDHDEPATALQNAGGPRADDRLLDLVEKDLDKAIEQPAHKRRLQFSQAVINHPRVRYFLNYFSHTQRGYFAKLLGRSGKYFPMMARVLQEEGLPEELAYLALIESNFDPWASSGSHAVGLWQFVPVTARNYGLKINSWLDERRDPVKSTRAAAAYLKDLHAYFDRWYLATAAYNAGLGAIDKALQSSGAKDFWSLSEKAKLSEETRNFVPKFVAAALIASNPEKYGFTAVSYETPLIYEEVEVGGNLQLAVAADMAGTDFKSLQELNPELQKPYTPPGETGFRLKIPAGYGTAFVRAYQERRRSEPVEIVTHKVRKGDTLWAIARRYGQEVGSLMKLNGLRTSRLRIGQQLKVILHGFTRQPR